MPAPSAVTHLALLALQSPLRLEPDATGGLPEASSVEELDTQSNRQVRV